MVKEKVIHTLKSATQKIGLSTMKTQRGRAHARTHAHTHTQNLMMAETDSRNKWQNLIKNNKQDLYSRVVGKVINKHLFDKAQLDDVT